MSRVFSRAHGLKSQREGWSLDELASERDPIIVAFVGMCLRNRKSGTTVRD